MQDHDRLARLSEKLGYQFSDPELLARALRHGSSAAAQEAGSYQRLEFLGDAVLGHAIAEMLFVALPDSDQGHLTRMRALLTQSATLARKAAELGLDELVEVGRSVESKESRRRRALLEDVFEAVVGAMAVDGGWLVAREFVSRLFAWDIAALDDTTLALADPKTVLQERAQAEGLPLPEYVEVGSSGPDHSPRWAFEVIWNGTVMGRGEAPSKREAQKQAARRALDRLGHRSGGS